LSAKATVGSKYITRGLRDLGVENGDVLLAHSSLSSFGHVDGGADAVIDALLAAVGQEGTLVLPTHTWDRVNARNPVFDAERTECCVGRIPETFRRRPTVRRGLHPTHSCAACGPRADWMLEGHETQVTPCGRRSPYQRLVDCGGKIALLGVTFLVNTSFHALEEMACVPWLFDRFELLYTVLPDGSRLPVPSRRHSDRLPRDFAKMEPVLEAAGALARGTIGDATVLIVDAALMERTVAPMLAEDPFLLLAPDAATRERDRYEAWTAFLGD
jgi:aminoglycoside 3-N-acetyltransferase